MLTSTVDLKALLILLAAGAVGAIVVQMLSTPVLSIVGQVVPTSA